VHNDLTFRTRVKKDFKKNKGLYLLILPVIVFYIIFCYGPMMGLSIAFEDYNPAQGLFGGAFVGFKYFKEFFNDYYFLRIIKNTVVISLSTLVFSFPAPIILALMVNEVVNRHFSRAVQTITYMPHFISTVVICGMVLQLTNKTGALTSFLHMFGVPAVTMLNQPNMFVPIYVITGIWQSVGWGSIIYLAALTNIDQELYNAAKVDGAGKFKQLTNVTLPCLMPTIVIMLILDVGKIFSIGYEKIILLYNPLTYETADVITTFVYRKGILEANWSYSTAIGLFNSVVSFALVFITNKLSKKYSGSSLW
jgi:putative aldouronate transport system permease protein